MKKANEKIKWDKIQKDLKKAKIEYPDFNVFKVLNIVNAEIRHSRIIAWLLDPNETHNQKEKYLKKFLKFIDEYGNDYVKSSWYIFFTNI